MVAWLIEGNNMPDSDHDKFNKEIHTMAFFEREWGIHHGSLLRLRLAGNGLNEDQICVALWAMLYTCSECRNYHSGCQCWNDE